MSAAPGKPVAVPRPWLIAVTILLVLPWLVVGYVYQRGPAPVSERVAPLAQQTTASGPWGNLILTPIVISPPIEYVSTDLWPAATLTWTFPGSTIDEVENFLNVSGLTPADVARLKAASTPDPRIHGIVITPPMDLVERLTPEVRGRIYLQLGRSGLNFEQAQAFRFETGSLDDWLKGAPIQAATRQLVEPYFYREGNFLYFADLGLLEPKIADREEFRRLTKALFRQPSVLVDLSLGPGGDVATIAQYWGKGGRRTDIRPLLDSIAGTSAHTDIAHLLPAFARDHLYRYPRVSTADFDKPILANCLWSSLNFFNAVPDDSMLDVNKAIDRLKTQYYVVEADFELGDIVAFVDEKDNLFHVAVYLADGLLFSKNGMSVMAPWTITSIDSVKAFYSTRSQHPRVIVHRRNDL